MFFVEDIDMISSFNIWINFTGKIVLYLEVDSSWFIKYRALNYGFVVSEISAVYQIHSPALDIILI